MSEWQDFANQWARQKEWQRRFEEARQHERDLEQAKEAASLNELFMRFMREAMEKQQPTPAAPTPEPDAVLSDEEATAMLADVFGCPPDMVDDILRVNGL